MIDDKEIIGFGAIEQEEKDSDFQLGAIAGAEPIPDEYMTPYTGIIYHQHKIPACGSHAGVYIKNIQEGRNHSPAYLWKRIKQIDGFKPEDGTSMEMIFKALQRFGVCSIDLMDNDTTNTLANYTNPSNITQEMDTDALNSRISSYAFQWNPTADDLKRNIYENKAVLILFRIGKEWWTPSWREKDILPLKATTPATSGHFVVAYGYDKDYIYFLNEWGTTWGRVGIGYFNNYYMPRCVQIGTCFDYIEKAPYVFKRMLKFGMRGTDVGVMQQILKDKGFFPIDQKITGNFLFKTLKSVKEFQESRGLNPDGLVGKLTQAELVK